MEINGVTIEDAACEAFAMAYARILVTAETDHWLDAAARAATGLATSIIGCGVEAGVESKADDTPDGRPGAHILFFARKKQTLEKQLVRRVGQAILTCPTTWVFNACNCEDTTDTGARLRFFGDGYQALKTIGGRRFWAIPVTEGEFYVEESFGIGEGVGGGSFLILGRDNAAATMAAHRAVRAIERLPGVILPFPGGVCRSASKVGSKYAFLNASTNEKFCPTLRREVETSLPAGVGSALEIVVDGVNLARVERAMRSGIEAACGVHGVVAISAAEFGGKLGGIRIGLRDILTR